MALRVLSTRAILALNLVGLLWIGSHYKVLGRSLEEEQSYNNSAKYNDLVVNLPGQPNVSFAHYAGYVTVNQTHGRALFYWFFEAISEPTSKPLLLWLNGGPGCSSVGYGEAEELGPFRVNKDGASVSLNSYAWNNEVNLLFLESPAGVGFSYSNTTNDYNEFGDIQTALDAYSFLLGWLERFPEYKTRDFFIAGESYAGHYVPQLAKLITDMNKAGSSKINLKGIMMGNALVNDGLDTKGIVDYAWSHAVLSDAFYANISMVCGNYNETEAWPQDCVDLLVYMYNISYAPIDIFSIYSDVCVESSPQNKTQFMKALNVKHLMSNMIIPSGGGGGGYDPCISDYVMTYLNRPDVQQALHATQTGPSFQWSGCSILLTNWTDSPFSMLPILKELMGDGLRLWMFSGDWDGRIPVLSTRYSIGSLNLPTKIDWYPWYYQQQVAGWSQVYEGITFATVRGAGHMVPSFQPGRVLALLSKFLDGSPLPASPQS